jgi:triphosphatase
LPLETELKLDVAPQELKTIAGLPWLKKLEQDKPKQQKLVSVYFDTPKRVFKKHGLTLRVRHAADKNVQKVKRGTAAVGRGEWEGEVASNEPERAVARRSALRPLASKNKWRKLRPVFETMVRRTIVPLRYHGALIELALDQGKLAAHARTFPIREVELELKEGEVAALAELARRLSQTAPISLNFQSKAERGYALADEQMAKPVKAQEVGIAAAQNAAQAFTTIALACLRHLTANRAAVLKGDCEGVHQMRVGLSGGAVPVQGFAGRRRKRTNQRKSQMAERTTGTGPGF